MKKVNIKHGKLLNQSTIHITSSIRTEIYFQHCKKPWETL